MRKADGAYQRELRRCATGACGNIGYLGDQTLYSLMKERTPALFHTLPCGWNRQLSVHYFNKKKFKESHECRSSCGLVHGNQPAFKGMMPQMQTEGRPPTCDECRQGVAHLRKGNPHMLGDPADPQGYSAETLLRCCCESSRLEGHTPLLVRGAPGRRNATQDAHRPPRVRTSSAHLARPHTARDYETLN